MPSIAVVMISLNEEHNIYDVVRNISGWASEIFLVDSYSTDATVERAVSLGVHVVQRRFRGFGDQWNFAINTLPISSPWVMKLDPDERLTDELKQNIGLAIARPDADADGYSIERRLWFMGRRLPHTQRIVRIWKRGKCKFSDVAVNEHPLIDGKISFIPGEMQHLDSPDLDHWFRKQNKYSTAEAISLYQGGNLSVIPKLFGTYLQRRMWMKKHFRFFPGRFTLLFFYYYLCCGAWKSGRVGYVWARLRCDLMRIIEYKYTEMKIRGSVYVISSPSIGVPDCRVAQYD